PPIAVGSPAAQDENPRTMEAAVGGGGNDILQMLAFFPQTITIHTGDTITWRPKGGEIHTVSFRDGFDPGSSPAGLSLPLATPGQRVPAFAVPIPGAPPEALQFNPLLAFPTRSPGASIESWNGQGFVSSGTMLPQPLVPGAPPNDVFSV